MENENDIREMAVGGGILVFGLNSKDIMPYE